MSDWHKNDPFTPVYRRLERDFIALTEHVWMSDGHKGVFSPVAGDIVLRAVAEIEAISKNLYVEHCPASMQRTHEASAPNKKSFPLFDQVCLEEYLIPQWDLAERVVVTDKSYVFWSEPVVKPFSDSLKKQRRGRRLTWGWNAAYQSLKHDRLQEMEWGSVEHALHALAGLYLLRLYWLQPSLDGARPGGSEIDLDFGSEVFRPAYCFAQEHPVERHPEASLLFEQISEGYGGSQTWYGMRLNTGPHGPRLPEAQLISNEGED